MVRPRSEQLSVSTVDQRVDGGRTHQRVDDLIVEEPLTVQLDDVVVATTMRTPGHDFELAVGLCQTEGLLDGTDVTDVRYCATGADTEPDQNVVVVRTAGTGVAATPRLTMTTSSCGICGTEAIEQIGQRLQPLPMSPAISAATVLDVCRRAIDGQGLFATTGGVHAAAVFTEGGAIMTTREDVGRHNAVDKVIGSMYLDHLLPATRLGLFVSGRASFELVHKAWSAGFSWMIAVSAPTSLAVATARRAGLHLVGFVRNERFNVYAPAPQG
ncbi:MAG TPA: formate dehydrogenase accessory sulfurtransferase FdhD [Ilumatobacteraceae bacterium]|nr:formate dehydrogenase accessory sulfurtransferase FdhD [Ilumatobacteraceae bacterium]